MHGAQELERAPERCTSFGVHSFALIQAHIFEARGCSSESCHGAALSGGLDLRAEVAWDQLFEAPASGSELLRVKPQAAAESVLYRKLRGEPHEDGGAPTAHGGVPLAGQELRAIQLWIDKGAPKWGAVSDSRDGSEVRSLLEPACQ